MQCRKQPRFLEGRPTPITDVWEVRLPTRLWEQICRLAHSRGVTFSTITRYCIFRLAAHHALRWKKKLLELHKEDRRAYNEAQGLHRHMVCFYGEDLKLVRIMALELGITVSAFIRLAVRLYLRFLAMEKQSRRYPDDKELFWRAIKIWLEVRFCPQVEDNSPLFLRHLPLSFPPEWRWGYPPGAILEIRRRAAE